MLINREHMEMKSIFKRSAIGMIVLGMAGTAMATTHHYKAVESAPANNGMWSTHMNGFFIGVEGLDLQPRNGDLDFVTLSPSNDSAYVIKAIDPDTQWD